MAYIKPLAMAPKMPVPCASCLSTIFLCALCKLCSTILLNMSSFPLTPPIAKRSSGGFPILKLSVPACSNGPPLIQALTASPKRLHYQIQKNKRARYQARAFAACPGVTLTLCHKYYYTYPNPANKHNTTQLYTYKSYANTPPSSPESGYISDIVSILSS